MIRKIFVGCVLAATATEIYLVFEKTIKLLLSHSFREEDGAFAVAHRHHLSAKRNEFLCSIESHVSRTGDSYLLALDINTLCSKHVKKEIYVAIAGCFRTHKRSAEIKTLTGECTGEFTLHLLIPAKHIAYFTATYAYVTSGNVGVGTDVAGKLLHEGLAETHHFHVALTAW